MARRPVYNRHTGVLIPPPPPYHAAHLLYIFHGVLPGGTKWTCGLRTEAATPTPDAMQILADYAVRCWSRGANTANSINSVNPPLFKFQGVTLRSLDVNGVTTAQVESVGGQVGSAPGQTAPDQTALAVSLHTNLAGRHGKGRIYLPILAPQFDGANPGKLAALIPFAIQGFIQQLINDLNLENALDPGPAPVTHYAICIQGRTLAATGAPVSEVLCGDVADTMRRRRRKLSETYTGGTPITPPVV